MCISERCEVALANAAKADNHDQVIAVRNKIKKLVDHINRVKDELYRNKDNASISEKYWRNVSGNILFQNKKFLS